MDFKYLEHTADLKIQASGKTLKQAFSNAAKGMFNAMVKIQDIKPEKKQSIEIQSENIESLFFDYISKLLYLHDVDNMLYSKFTIKSLKREEKGWSLKADIFGEKFNKKHHTPEESIKAMTYNQLKIEKKGKYRVITFLLDI